MPQTTHQRGGTRDGAGRKPRVQLGDGDPTTVSVRIGEGLLAALLARLATDYPGLGTLTASDALRAAAMLAVGQAQAPPSAPA